MVRLSLAGGQTDNRASPDRFIQGLAGLRSLGGGGEGGQWRGPKKRGRGGGGCIGVCMSVYVDLSLSVNAKTPENCQNTI